MVIFHSFFVSLPEGNHPWDDLWFGTPPEGRPADEGIVCPNFSRVKPIEVPIIF